MPTEPNHDLILDHLSDGLRHVEHRTVGGAHKSAAAGNAYQFVFRGAGAWLSISRPLRRSSVIDSQFAVRSTPWVKASEQEKAERTRPKPGIGPKHVETVASHGPSDPCKLAEAPGHARDVAWDDLREHAENVNALLDGAMFLTDHRVHHVTVRGGNLAAFTPGAGVVVPDNPAVFDHGVGATMAVHVADLWQALVLNAIPLLHPGETPVVKAWHDDLAVGVRIEVGKLVAVLLMRRKPADPRIDAPAQIIAATPAARFTAPVRSIRKAGNADMLLAVREGRVTIRDVDGIRDVSTARNVAGEGSVRVSGGDLWAGLNRLDGAATVLIPSRGDWPVLAYDASGTRYTMLLPRGV